MRSAPILLTSLLALGAFAATSAAWQPTPTAGHLVEESETVGQMATEPNATTWFNHIGAPVTLESLKGKVWIVEKWATW